MKEKALVGLLLSCWIIGVCLICLFPPVPDVQISHPESAYLSEDSVPELHLRNTPRAAYIQVVTGAQSVASVFEYSFDSELALLDPLGLAPTFIQTFSLFDTKILFRLFFEIW
jgi:hypothetical protein